MMKILAIDTSTRTCGICIADDGRPICELYLTSGQTHSRHLMPTICRALETAGLNQQDIDGYAVTRGPGSFTGLRIGISTAKGLACATGKPLFGISGLEALAHPMAGLAQRICPVLDARKKEVYYAVYRAEEGGMVEEVAPRVGPADSIPDTDSTTLFVGDGAMLYEGVIRHKHGKNAVFTRPELNGIRISAVAHLATHRFEKSEFDPVDTMAPLYIRKSDAEIARETHVT